MSLTWRPMQPKDVPECSEIIAEHSVIRPRYGTEIKNLRTVWMRLLGCDGMTTAVFEETHGTRVTILGVGVGVFVHDDFIRDLKTPPLFWIGAELTKRIMNRNSPVLSDKAVREANAREGLNQVAWEGAPRQQFANRSEVYHLIANTYVEVHHGFRLKEIIASQAESAERLQWSIDSGGLYWDPTVRRYVKSLPGDAKEYYARPHVVGMTRALEFARPGSWIGKLFDYRPPRFAFSRSEQKLLQSALRSEGGTDQELACTLSLSVPTVKKMWGSTYHRVAMCDPELLSGSGPVETGLPERGREKRRRLLAYIRQHPEELRPVSQRLLRQKAAAPEAQSSHIS